MCSEGGRKRHHARSGPGLFATRSIAHALCLPAGQVAIGVAVHDLATRLRSGPILVAPGVHDALSARIAEQAGCEALFVSGAALSIGQFASPDFGLVGATELAEAVARIADRVAVPVLVDGDSGHGNAAHVQRLVRALCRAGAAGVQIEDQVAVKPPSELLTRPLVPVDEMVGKIRAAQDARTSEHFQVSARTDALSTTGIDDALDRADAYVDAGCDLLFVEGAVDPAHIAAIVARFGGRAPLVHNLLEGGGTPFASAAEAEAAGFALALFPVTALGAAAHAMSAAYRTIATTASSASLADRLSGLPELNAIVGTADLAERTARYGRRKE